MIDTNIKNLFFEYTNKRYNQINNSSIIPNLSIVDLIFNEELTRSILKENFKLIKMIDIDLVELKKLKVSHVTRDYLKWFKQNHKKFIQFKPNF